MSDPNTNPPSLQQQTIELGKTLKAIADSDPHGIPSVLSGQVFADWIAAAGPGSREPGYFADVADNYAPPENTNRDLFDLFHMLESYIEVEDEDEPVKTFIGLPLLAPQADSPPRR